ncbi:MAG: hypothetical protein Q8K93_30070 [Reyranella sp.]|uniref:hypothetical protein n=1 Tax=Reyranella sp. TaxID=1929291 RepID=UPI0027301DEC|nr:hypothetical protein [Reyranella sp.]MDP1966437.1 hypothetical protein [Reyranella sp.]MDP2375846.1 hypothetical protein [Reyranella sp.]
MTMKPSNILVGKCYRDRFGAIYKVTSCDSQHIGFTAYMKAEDGGCAAFQGTEALPLFIRDLEEEVPCPEFASSAGREPRWPSDSSSGNC